LEQWLFISHLRRPQTPVTWVFRMAAATDPVIQLVAMVAGIIAAADIIAAAVVIPAAVACTVTHRLATSLNGTMSCARTMSGVCQLAAAMAAMAAMVAMVATAMAAMGMVEVTIRPLTRKWGRPQLLSRMGTDTATVAIDASAQALRIAVNMLSDHTAILATRSAGREQMQRDDRNQLERLLQTTAVFHRRLRTTRSHALVVRRVMGAWDCQRRGDRPPRYAADDQVASSSSAWSV
jgi:hypothetical protein